MCSININGISSLCVTAELSRCDDASLTKCIYKSVNINKQETNEQKNKENAAHTGDSQKTENVQFSTKQAKKTRKSVLYYYITYG